MQYRDEKTRFFAETVGKVVKDLRLAKDCSINKFAHDYGLDVGNTSRVEKGVIEVKLVTLWKIAEALEMSPSQLLNLVENKLGKDFHFYEE